MKEPCLGSEVYPRYSPLRIVAVLDTMWGDKEGQAPRFFKINPRNHSGRRLYQLVGIYSSRLVVTNVCRELVCHAKHHGTPDPEWLSDNLIFIRPDLILVCGKVAEKCFRKAYGKHFILGGAKVICIPHPAARNWTKRSISAIKRKIEKALGDM